MPLNPINIGAALNEKLTLHSSLCRREAGDFQRAIQTGEDVVVACTQEKRLFSELAEQTQGATSVIRFVNVRETGGWSKDASQSSPKLAAQLVAAHLPEPEPVTTVSYSSSGRLLIIGKLDAAEHVADLLGDDFNTSIFTLGVGQGEVLQERKYPILGGDIKSLTGWLGEFKLTWMQNNPIDLDLCTRCNACVAACPEGAIGLDYQIDLDACKSHRACVKACQVAAINFSREVESSSDTFDLVLDLRPAPAFTQHAVPQGYFHSKGTDAQVLLKIKSLVGEFEKPRFVAYKQKLCAHSRNEKIGCSACMDVCSASAISSDFERQQIKVNPHLCVGCGTCSTVCPTGALSYGYPRASEQGVKLKALISTYARSGGKNAALLLHSQVRGQSLVNDLGRAARLDKDIHGVPARVIPVSLWHTSSMGLDVWLSAICYGASQVWVLMTDEEAPQYKVSLTEQMAVAQSILTGLGYTGEHFKIMQVKDARDLATLDRDLQSAPAQVPLQVASFAVQAEKRTTLELALDHLINHAPVKTKAEHIALPTTGSPLGAIKLNKEACTLCLSCVNACPANALQDNVDAPQLKFIEKNCVQCGLCVKTCPEKALSLVPQLNLLKDCKEAVLLNEMQPYACIRCNKPFGTLKGIEAMLGKLAGHSMFQGAALERLKMCSDCRVIDIHTSSSEAKITDL
ncbi:MAG: 4Fe-4S binding protein [Polaromonas sp.]|nr:4Fe-4S binding protein [Polaromonas sp.]